MDIIVIKENKKQYLDLLLLADEQEDMIDRYLERGTLFALYDGDLRSVCVVTDEGDGVCELQNIATDARYQGKGYGSALVRHVLAHYAGEFDTMLVGTGDSPLTIPFYQRNGFVLSHRLPNYFLEHYDRPIMENGVQLFDKVYLSQRLTPRLV